MRLTTRFALPAGLACAGALAFAASDARAQDAKGTTATLGWARLDGAETCIGTQELAQAVEKLLGRSVFVPASEAELAIEGLVDPKRAGAGFARLGASPFPSTGPFGCPRAGRLRTPA